MAESEKKNSSSVSLKDKDLLLGDLDLRKVSIADGDGMDTDLTPGNKKPFNFDRLDMDFNLDGYLGKISSFNMDMSDLDTSLPLTKDGQLKEKPKESSIGENKNKADHVSFAFDIDEEVRNDLWRKTPDIPPPKDIKPVRNIGILRKKRSPHFLNSEKQTLPTVSTKRNTFEHEHGTTILGIACVDDDYVATIGDGRCFQMKRGYSRITKEDDKGKIRINKAFIASCSGSGHFGNKLIDELEDEHENLPTELKENLENVISSRNLNVCDWKKECFVPDGDFDPYEEMRRNNKYPASVVLYGLEQKYIHVVVDCGDDVFQCEFVVQGKTMKVVCHGGGGTFALDHLIDNKERIVSLSAALELLKEALGAASLVTIDCGGYTQTAVATRVGISILVEKPHVTEIIGSKFEHLTKHMTHMLIISTHGGYMEDFEWDLESKREEALLAVRGIVESSILGFDFVLGKTFRWLRFETQGDLENFSKSEIDDDIGYIKCYLPTEKLFKKLSVMIKKSENCWEVRSDDGSESDSSSYVGLDSDELDRSDDGSDSSDDGSDSNDDGSDSNDDRFYRSCASFSMEVNDIATQSSGNPTTIPMSKNTPLRQESGMALKISREVRSDDEYDSDSSYHGLTSTDDELDKSEDGSDRGDDDSGDDDTSDDDKSDDDTSDDLSSCASFSLEVNDIATQRSGNPTTAIPMSKNTPLRQESGMALKISSEDTTKSKPTSTKDLDTRSSFSLEVSSLAAQSRKSNDLKK